MTDNTSKRPGSSSSSSDDKASSGSRFGGRFGSSSKKDDDKSLSSRFGSLSKSDDKASSSSRFGGGSSSSDDKKSSGSRFGSRFGSSSKKDDDKTSSSSSQFGGSRPTPRTVSTTIQVAPLETTIVSFSTSLWLPQAFATLDLSTGDAMSLNQYLSQIDTEKQEIISSYLDQLWQEQGIRGARLLFTLPGNLNRLAKHRLNPGFERVQTDEKDSDYEDEYYYDDDEEYFDYDNEPVADKRTVRVLQSIDMFMMMNVLGRVQGDVLFADTPFDFHRISQSKELYSDDPELVSLVCATGFLGKEEFNGT